MTEAEKIALDRLRDCGFKGGYIDRKWNASYEALCRAIEQHEAFKRELSEAVEKALSYGGLESLRREAVLSRFIIKPPVDPLVETLCAAIASNGSGDFVDHATMQKALAARGLQITEIGQ